MKKKWFSVFLIEIGKVRDKTRFCSDGVCVFLFDFSSLFDLKSKTVCSLPKEVNTIMSANVKMHWQIWQYKYRTTNIILNRERQFFLFMLEWLRNKTSLYLIILFKAILNQTMTARRISPPSAECNQLVIVIYGGARVKNKILYRANIKSFTKNIE